MWFDNYAFRGDSSAKQAVMQKMIEDAEEREIGSNIMGSERKLHTG